MRFGSWPTLLLAAVIAGPALWHGFVTRDMDPTTALERYLLAVVVAGVMIWAVGLVTDGYAKQAKAARRKVRVVVGKPIPDSNAPGKQPQTPTAE